MKEANIQRQIMLAAGAKDYTLWRNNTGQAWQGQVTRLPNGSILIDNPRPVQFGLSKGSSDLIGIKRVTVTQDMVGQQVAVFSALEVKTPRGNPTEEQRQFLNFVAGAGGIAGIARGPEDLP